MTDRLEWAHAGSGAELLYPGSDIDGAVVEPGEIAVAMWTGSNGIALFGPREQLRDRLLQLAAAVHSAPPVPAEEGCIAEKIDPSEWHPAQIPTVQTDAARGKAWCGDDRPIAMDPRLATCESCIEIWNSQAPRVKLRLHYSVPGLK
ncbi:hypothetical protein [Streptomyces chartreusis]|uniref:hypothetical protein n=1 Tax=Streptomyces chartreusis TaxID=1969 RepID=UPI0033B6583F